MPRGEDAEIVEPADFMLFVARFLVAPRALTFFLFFTRLPSLFENSMAANRGKIQVIHEVLASVLQNPGSGLSLKNAMSH
jgi:hypothetical protein